LSQVRDMKLGNWRNGAVAVACWLIGHGATAEVGLVARDICQDDIQIIYNITTQIIIFPVYINTYVTTTTTLIIQGGDNIEIWYPPTSVMSIVYGTTTEEITSTTYVFPICRRYRRLTVQDHHPNCDSRFHSQRSKFSGLSNHANSSR
jgi:hypothetical protein